MITGIKLADNRTYAYALLQCREGQNDGKWELNKYIIYYMHFDLEHIYKLIDNSGLSV